VVGAPILFGVSTFIVQVLRAQFVNIQVPAAAVSSTSSGIAGALLGGAQAGVSPEFVFFFSLVNLFVSSLFAALTIGVINTGKEKNGFKYLIPIFGVSLALFYATRELMVTTFGQLL
ncbi:MAG TPA: hypothetical protein VJI67_00150, partial [archaeon]|nr:hypothetical protein [archaeon]